MPATHAVYLKRFCQQSHPWNGTYWMLDEAQDWPNAVLDAFHRCTRVSIRAGDPCQRLYAFRGASFGAWHNPDMETEFRLSTSWRASEALAPWLNDCLQKLPGGWVWHGQDNVECEVQPRSETSTLDELVAFNPTAVLMDRWKPLERLAKTVSSHYRIVWPEGLERQHVQTDALPNLFLSTIHSAKGMEFNRLWLPDELVQPGLSPAQTARLFYVALSRASRAVSFRDFNRHAVSTTIQDDVLFEESSLDTWFV